MIDYRHFCTNEFICTSWFLKQNFFLWRLFHSQLQQGHKKSVKSTGNTCDAQKKRSTHRTYGFGAWQTSNESTHASAPRSFRGWHHFCCQRPGMHRVWQYYMKSQNSLWGPCIKSGTRDEGHAYCSAICGQEFQLACEALRCLAHQSNHYSFSTNMKIAFLHK